MGQKNIYNTNMLQVLSIRNMKGSYSTPLHTETPWWHKTISGIVHLPISTPPCSIVAAIRGKLIIDNFPPFSLTHTLEIYIQKMHFPLFMGKTPVLLILPSELPRALEKFQHTNFRNIQQPFVIKWNRWLFRLLLRYRSKPFTQPPSHKLHTYILFSWAFSVCKSLSVCKTSGMIRAVQQI